MDYFTALAELGLSEGELTRDRVRRTYLRRLRHHPPERDPDGFKRLRSAFELLRELASDEEPVATSLVELAPEPLPTLPLPSPTLPLPTLPLPPMARPEPPEALSAVLPRILALLAGGEVAAAVVLEEKWRERADDIRQGWVLDVARWALTRELLGVAGELPPPVVAALARALERDDLSLARNDLIAFRLSNAQAAGDANVLLFRRANSIFKQIEGTLFLPTRIAAPFLQDINRIIEQSRRVPDRLPRERPPKSSTQVFVYGGLALLGLILKITMATPHSYSPPSYYKPIEIPRFQMPPEMLFIPPPMPRLIERDQSPLALTSQVIESSHILGTYDIASKGQKQAAAAMEAAAGKGKCDQMRMALTMLRSQLPHTVELRKLYADMHIQAVRDRVEQICKKGGK